MTPEFCLEFLITPALSLLPEKMNSPASKAMLLAIAMQESRLKHRKQVGGPAKSYWQFEQGGGVRGVLTHAASKAHIQSVLTALDYATDSDAAFCYAAIEDSDILAAAFARLLLWTLPDKLPGREAPGTAWSQYLKSWRPGRPHRETFDAFYAEAWDIVQS